MLAITVGNGLTRPMGVYTPIPEPAVDSLARILSELPAIEEGWWSGHLWKDNLRRANQWLATSVITLDVDYEADGDPFPEHREAMVELAATGKLPGSIFHLTPHGARVLFAMDRPYSEKKDLLAASAAAVILVSDAIAGSGYKVDEPVARDLARLYFTPNARAKGMQRHADVVVMRREQYTASQLIADATPAPAPEPPPRKLSIVRNQSFEQAAAQWSADHRREYPVRPSRCPVCDHDDCFHALPADTSRWFCFSTQHTDGVGLPHHETGGHHGDALDIEAHERRCKPVDVLRADGYLGTPRRAAAPASASGAAPEAEPETEPTPAPAGAFRPWRSRSYLTAVSIIESNARDVLEGRRLEFNEMSGDITLARKPIKDSEVNRIRGLIEARFVGGVDKNNNEIGLQLSPSDMFSAIAQVAESRPYNPVREYLNELKWDGVERISHVAADLLNAEDTEINRAMVQKFFVSAVARAMEPGCKVDTVLVLVGKQGALKSSFFSVLAGDWFLDTPIDISSDPTRAYMTMRKAWILEWAELESLFRARDSNSVKAFLSSASDEYIPKYGRSRVEVKRSGVIVGTINPDQFLTDDTGHRRFWPVKVGDIDTKHTAEQRDQLWAEAAYLYRAWVNAGRQLEACPWWLSDRESGLLRTVHDDHRTVDAWEGPVMEWLQRQAGMDEVTVQELLANALSIPKGQWTDRDAKRVVSILRASGEWKSNPNKKKGTPRSWIRTGGNDRGEND